VFDRMLQHERTALAWERTAIAAMVAGLLFVRVASGWHLALTLIGFAQVLLGAGLLIWAGYHYDDLHGELRAGRSPIRPGATRLVGAVTAVFTGLATITTIAATSLGLWS
jgi:uncharacterized membrane protein YidH (DUF202 family)